MVWLSGRMVARLVNEASERWGGDAVGQWWRGEDNAAVVSAWIAGVKRGQCIAVPCRSGIEGQQLCLWVSPYVGRRAANFVLWGFGEGMPGELRQAKRLPEDFVKVKPAPLELGAGETWLAWQDGGNWRVARCEGGLAFVTADAAGVAVADFARDAVARFVIHNRPLAAALLWNSGRAVKGYLGFRSALAAAERKCDPDGALAQEWRKKRELAKNRKQGS